jgi:hypothetical protein
MLIIEAWAAAQEGVSTLAELKQSNQEKGDSEELKSLIDHWVHVIDSWVQGIDEGMGGTAEGADPAESPDSAPQASTSPPAVEAN